MLLPITVLTYSQLAELTYEGMRLASAIQIISLVVTDASSPTLKQMGCMQYKRDDDKSGCHDILDKVMDLSF